MAVNPKILAIKSRLISSFAGAITLLSLWLRHCTSLTFFFLFFLFLFFRSFAIHSKLPRGGEEGDEIIHRTDRGENLFRLYVCKSSSLKNFSHLQGSYQLTCIQQLPSFFLSLSLFLCSVSFFPFFPFLPFARLDSLRNSQGSNLRDYSISRFCFILFRECNLRKMEDHFANEQFSRYACADKIVLVWMRRNECAEVYKLIRNEEDDFSLYGEIIVWKSVDS